ncbi:NAD(P)-binding protein [Xylaria sp. FL0043]|nr:NAD(P)-binding protein [Xylaria sp. FL0043]
MPDFDVTPEKRATQRAFLKRQLFVTPPAVTRADANVEGKTAIITGSNTGLGFEAARQLVDLGISRLILAVRSETKGQIAKRQLLVGKNPDKQVVEVWPLDLSSYESVTSFVGHVKTLDRLDIFINNAGLTKLNFELNKNTGHEETIQVNYLSHVLLVILLLPILKEKNSPEHPGRMVMVNSEVASWPKFKEQDSVPLLAALDQKSNFQNQDRYFTSKLLCQLFLFELVKRIPPTVAVINAPNPGLCISSLSREANGTFGGFAFDMIKKLIGRSTSLGARTLTDAAVRHGAESHGQYLEDCKIQPLAPILYQPKGQKLAEQLWKETMEELSFAGAADIITSLSDKQVNTAAGSSS